MRAVQPGHDPGRRPQPHEQVDAATSSTPTTREPLRRRHGARLPDVHRPMGPGRPVEPRHRGRASVPGPGWGVAQASGGHPRSVPGMPAAQSLAGEPPGTAEKGADAHGRRRWEPGVRQATHRAIKEVE